MEQRLKSLDGLRGVAALTVLFHHLLLISPSIARANFGGDKVGWRMRVLFDTPLHVLWGGSEAVWVFFILSGYVLTRRQLHGATLRVGTYYWRRACRLYIPVAGSMVLAVLLRAIPHRALTDGSWWLNAHSPTTGVRSALHSLLLFRGNNTSLNTVWWSLQWEAWFSLLVPVLLLLLAPVRRHLWVFGLGCLFVIWWFPTTVHTLQPDVWDHAPVYLSLFGIGIALAAYEPTLLAAKWFGHPSLGWLALLVTAAIYWFHFSLSNLTTSLSWTAEQFGSVSRTCTAVGAAGALVLALSFPPLARALSWRPVEWLGLRSFSLYLVHEPIIVSLAFAFHLEELPLWFVIVAPAVSLAATEVFYRAVEKPSMALGRRLQRRTPAFA